MLENIDTIDYMHINDKCTDELIIGIHDSHEWINVPAHLGMLEDKLNTYMKFILEKQWLSIHPDWHINHIRIEIRFLNLPVAEALDYIKLANVQVAQYYTQIVAIKISEEEKQNILDLSNTL